MKLLRPTSSKVIKSIFDIINNYDFESNIFLDLFSGSGMIAVSAFLKGYEVTAIEKNRKHFELIKKNVKKKNTNIELINNDAVKYLNTVSKKFDVIFIDPPYEKRNLYLTSFEIILNRKLLNDDGIIIFEKSSKINLHFDDEKYIVKKYSYGDTELIVIKLTQS